MLRAHATVRRVSGTEVRHEGDQGDLENVRVAQRSFCGVLVRLPFKARVF